MTNDVSALGSPLGVRNTDFKMFPFGFDSLFDTWLPPVVFRWAVVFIDGTSY